MDERNNDFDFDFTPIGLAIKKARTAQGMTREQLARIVDYDPRHLQAIENEGQKPSLELFIQLMTMFNSVILSYSVLGSKNNAHIFCERYCCHIDFRYKMRHREERFFYCPQSRSFWQRA